MSDCPDDQQQDGQHDRDHAELGDAGAHRHERRGQRDHEGEEDRELAVRGAGGMRQRGDVRAHQHQADAEREPRQPRPRQDEGDAGEERRGGGEIAASA